MDLLEYEAYFRDEIASKKIIGHSSTVNRFVMLDDDELAGSQGTLDNNGFYMVLHKYESEPYTNQSGKYVNRHSCGFTIAKNIGKGVSQKQAKVLQSEAEVIVNKIWAKMLKNEYNQNFGLGTLSKEPKDTIISFIKGMFGNGAGATISFVIQTSIHPYTLVLDDDWT